MVAPGTAVPLTNAPLVGSTMRVRPAHKPWSGPNLLANIHRLSLHGGWRAKSLAVMVKISTCGMAWRTHAMWMEFWLHKSLRCGDSWGVPPRFKRLELYKTSNNLFIYKHPHIHACVFAMCVQCMKIHADVWAYACMHASHVSTRVHAHTCVSAHAYRHVHMCILLYG